MLRGVRATPQGGDLGLEASTLPADADSELPHLEPPPLQPPCCSEAMRNKITGSGRRSSDHCAQQGDNTETTDIGQPERRLLRLVQQLVPKAPHCTGRQGGSD